MDCPDCTPAAFVWPEQPYTLCAYCFNGAVGNRWRRVALPDADAMDEIEEIVAFRDMPWERNWDHTETADDLRAENAQHGKYVPPKKPKPPKGPALAGEGG